MLMDIVYVVSSEGYFWVVWIVSESEYLVKLLGLSAGDGEELISRGVRGIWELGAKELSF